MGFLIKAATDRPGIAAEAAQRLREWGFAVASSIRVPAGSGPNGLRLAGGPTPVLEAGRPISRKQVFALARSASSTPRAVAAQLRAHGFVVAEVGFVPDDAGGALPLDWVVRIGQEGLPAYSEILGTAHAQGRSPEYIASQWADAGIPVPDAGSRLISPDEATLLSHGLNAQSRWIESPSQIGLAHVLAAALRLRRDTTYLVEAARGFGIAVADPHGVDATPIATPDLLLLSQAADLEPPWIDSAEVSRAHVYRAAASTGQAPGDVADRLQKLGFASPEVSAEPLSAKEDAALSVLLDSHRHEPRRTPSISRASLLAAAHRTGEEPRRLRAWVSELGFPTKGLQNLPREAVDLIDLMLLSWNINRDGPWLPDEPIPRGRVLSVAGAIGRRPAEVAARYRELGFDAPDTYEAQAPGPDAVDLTLLSRALDEPWEPIAATTIPLAHIVRAACLFHCDVAEIVERYRTMGFTVPDAREMTASERAMVTVALYNADTCDLAADRISLPQILGVTEFTHESADLVAETLAAVGLTVAPLPATLPELAPRDAFILSAKLTSEGPWLGGAQVARSHVIAAAAHIRCAPAIVRDRLIELGCDVSDLRASRDDDVVDGNDAVLVGALRDTDGGHRDRPITHAEVLYMSYRLRETPEDIVRHYNALGFSVPSYDEPAAAVANLTHDQARARREHQNHVRRQVPGDGLRPKRGSTAEHPRANHTLRGMVEE